MTATIRRDERDFLRQAKAARRDTGKTGAYLLSVLVVVFLGVFVFWADNAVLDEVTRGDARVVPSRKVQVVQNLEGGILESMKVSEGDIVREDQVLATLDATLMRSSYDEARGKYLNLSAAVTRLRAEVAGAAPAFSAELQDRAPAVVADERALYQARQRELDASLSLQDSRIRQKQQEIAELRSRANQLARNLGLARKELAITEPLAASGTMSQLDLLRIQRTVSDLSGELQTVRLSVERAQSALQEAGEQKQEIRAQFDAKASAELNQKQAELDAVAERVTAGQDRFDRTDVRSPVDGTVKQIFKTTVGGVVQPGEDILEIVPLDDTLLVETRVRPADIAFLHPDQPTKVKLTAYDFSVYGGLDGEVERISADTITDDEGNSFYKVYVRTQDNVLRHNGESLPIIPGMTATVDILTGEKSVLDYLLKPILKARDSALRER